MTIQTALTRKEAHAEGINFLRQAIDAADQADSCFRDGKTNEQVSVGGCSSMEAGVAKLEGLLKYAELARCEECDLLIADCACYYSKAVR
jgi:hypothetical protein